MDTVRLILDRIVHYIPVVSNCWTVDLCERERGQRDPDCRIDDTSWRAVRDILSSSTKSALPRVDGNTKQQRVQKGSLLLIVARKLETISMLRRLPLQICRNGEHRVPVHDFSTVHHKLGGSMPEYL